MYRGKNLKGTNKLITENFYRETVIKTIISYNETK